MWNYPYDPEVQEGNNESDRWWWFALGILALAVAIHFGGHFLYFILSK